MSWQDELRIYFEKEDYERCIHLLKTELAKPFRNDEDLILNLMYVYMYVYILKKTSNTLIQMMFLEKNILTVYKFIGKKYKKSAKAIFYTAYISSIAEWIMDLTLEDLNEMYYKAFNLEPNNKLYRYGYYLYYLGNKQKANIVYDEIRSDANCGIEIKKMSILGDSFIETMEYFYDQKQ